MAGKAKAVNNGNKLQDDVIRLGESLGLKAEKEVKVGRRIWGAKRYIDVVLTHSDTRIKIGIECKYQAGGGSAEEKIPSTLEDIQAWPVKGIVVIDGPGFSQNMKGYLTSTGSVIEYEDLQDWLKLYFGL